ncbi:MAG: nucleotidyltransferase family protein [Polyangiales bacterium]
MSTSIACVVLAAGRSARLGRPKQLVSVDGHPLVRRTAIAARASRCRHVGVVLGAASAAVERALFGVDVARLANPAWETGLASSLAVAVEFAEARGADALLVCVCDQPHLSTAHLDALCAAHVGSGRAVASAYAGILGVPAVFPRARFAALRTLQGDRGAGALLRNDREALTIAWPEGAVDLDTPEDLARLPRDPDAS